MHKANIMKLGDGLFLNTCKRVAEQEYGHTGIKFDSMIVDNTSMQLVSKPQQFDVMVMVRLLLSLPDPTSKQPRAGEGLADGWISGVAVIVIGGRR